MQEGSVMYVCIYIPHMSRGTFNGPYASKTQPRKSQSERSVIMALV